MIVLRVLYLALCVAITLFVHWSLPHSQVVRIVDTEIARETVTVNNDTGAEQTRDVRFINTITPEGHARVFRNVDTGWGWPPYFKFDSADLSAEASDLESDSESPRWVIVRAHGWRLAMFSVFPNALSLRLAEGPYDAAAFPWLNVVVLGALFTLFAVGGYRLNLWRRRRA
jgi:hypothetical protein